MTMGDSGAAALAAPCPAAQPCHLGGGAGFIDEDKPLRVKVELTIEPDFPRRLHIAALLFACMRCLFLNVMARLSKKCQTVEGAARTPCSFARRSAIS